MNCDYTDIISRIPEEPQWFDEFAVPRYCAFEPGEIADIYAYECALVLIECQSCERPFRVVVSMGATDLIRRGDKGLPPPPWIDPKTVEYGDPPNVGCCPAGPTMNSVPKRVLEFWSRHQKMEWERLPQHEVEIDCEWMKDGGL